MDVFYALAEPTRRSIIEMLARAGKLSVSEIGRNFKVTPPAISQHLKVLKQAKLVTVEKRAQQRIYTINPDAMQELEGWAKEMSFLWNRRFDALEKVLEEQQKKEKKK